MSDTTELLGHIKLHFNVEHPSLEECYLHGYESAKEDETEEANPFKAHTAEHAHWQDGWWAGFYEEAPLFSYDEEPSQKEPVTAANEDSVHFITSLMSNEFLANVLRITGAIAATAVVGYQVFELVA
ncbi:MAG: transmission trait enhancer LetE [Tatlockia sp.]|jgi:hypothetical protein